MRNKASLAGSEVPQGSVLGPINYICYILQIPHTHNITIAIFADAEEAIIQLHYTCNKIKNSTKKWRIKLNDQPTSTLQTKGKLTK